jgi:hypothetical protein
MPVALVDGLPPPYEAPSPRPPVAVILAVILPVVGAAVIIALGTWAVNRAYARGLIIRPVPPPVTNLEDVTILVGVGKMVGVCQTFHHRGSRLSLGICCSRLVAILVISLLLL